MLLSSSGLCTVYWFCVIRWLLGTAADRFVATSGRVVALCCVTPSLGASPVPPRLYTRPLRGLPSSPPAPTDPLSATATLTTTATTTIHHGPSAALPTTHALLSCSRRSQSTATVFNCCYLQPTSMPSPVVIFSPNSTLVKMLRHYKM